MKSPVRRSRRAAILLALVGILEGQIVALASDEVINAPNVVVISPNLVTSGQPTAAALAKLAAQGFGAVIYLAPMTVSDAVPGEAEIIQKQGLEFVNIPIQFDKPTEADFDAFSKAMNRLRNRKILVHCQINIRASTMTFLYRVIVGRDEPEQAYESVTKVWVPEGPWKRLAVYLLRKADVTFEPY